jgi:pimeloyl-ACP methyl ester carboxylesterase
MQNGNRPPVVLLPGLTYDKRHFEPLVRELAILEPSRRVLSLELPGHRDSLPPSSYAISGTTPIPGRICCSSRTARRVDSNAGR